MVDLGGCDADLDELSGTHFMFIFILILNISTLALKTLPSLFKLGLCSLKGVGCTYLKLVLELPTQFLFLLPISLLVPVVVVVVLVSSNLMIL